jgi:phenylpropionate dioxygenase-like ring-hydroxylating dioxygenase large terminal subunit
MSTSNQVKSLPLRVRDDGPDLRKIGLHPDHWYPLARSRDVKTGKAIGRTFAGEPIVLVRTEGGRLFALEDRSERIPKGVRKYPCREAYGLIFVFPGNPALAETAFFPDIPAYADPKYKTRYLDHQVTCHYSFLHENLMDMNHQFLHRKIMARIKTGFLGLREGDDWVEVDYTFTRVGKQPMGEKVMLGKRPETTTDRDMDLMTVRTQYPNQILKFWTAGSEHPALDLWITYIPVDAKQRINHTFGLINVRRPAAVPWLLDLLWPFIVYFTNGIFGEDKWVVEMEQAAFDTQGADWNQEIFPVILKVRDLLSRSGVPIEGA